MGNSSSASTTGKYEIDLSAPSQGGLTPIGRDKYVLLVLGPSKVGKTSLIVQFVQNRFVAEDETTVENTYRKTCVVDDKTVLTDIVETSGYEAYQPMMDQYMRMSQGFLIVYSVTDRNSFDRCIETYTNILRVKDQERVPVVLVGTKSDSADRVVSKAHGEELAKQHGWSFFETTAKYGTNVDEAFHEIVRQISDSRIMTSNGGGGKK